MTETAQGRLTHCPRCKRPLAPWPLERPDLCSQPYWKYCIRTLKAIHAEEYRAKWASKGLGGAPHEA